MERIGVREAYRGRSVLVTGASGFVGKVWMLKMLVELPETARIYVLLRPRGTQRAADRLADILQKSPATQPLHDIYGADMAQKLAGRLIPVDGDVELPNLGLTGEAAVRLPEELDLIVHCAGLVDFDPDFRDSIRVNIDGSLNVAEFASNCRKAAVVHVSTCYVAGLRHGTIDETVRMGMTPNGDPLDPEKEVAAARAQADRIVQRMQSPAQRTRLDELVAKRLAYQEVDTEDEAAIAKVRAEVERRELERLMIDEGKRRATRLGWPNTYTWSKALSEQIVEKRYPNLRMAIVRPSVVESALKFPFPGWNEGFNTTGPFVYLAGTWAKHMPGRRENPFDVIPVDFVCNAITTVGASLILRRPTPSVFHAGTTDWNVLTIGRIVDLVALHYRKHLMANGKTAIDRIVRSRWEFNERPADHIFSMTNAREAASSLAKGLRAIRKAPVIGPLARQGASELERLDKPLAKLERVNDLFQPFTHDLYQTFRSGNLRALQAEEEQFRFDPSVIDWRDYWINIHVPGLAKWSFPVMLKKPVETLSVPYTVQLPTLDDLAAVALSASTDTPSLQTTVA